MKKVAYNACFGGFSLSSSALHEFAGKKGVSLTWYKKTGDEEYERIQGTPTGSLSSTRAATKDLGGKIKAIGSGAHYYPSFNGDARCDPDLISVIEEFGDLANGNCADLQIEEIPDGAEFEISEYDGRESVVPPRQAW